MTDLPACDLAVSGLLVLPDGPPVHGEVRITAGRIDAVVAESGAGPATRTLDAGDAYVLAGAVDAHVHCLSNPGEGIEAATRAAAAGGVTTIVEMPYDAGDPVNNVGTLEAKKKRVADEAVIDVALLATVRPQGGASDVGGARLARRVRLQAFAVRHRFTAFPSDSRRPAPRRACGHLRCRQLGVLPRRERRDHQAVDRTAKGGDTRRSKRPQPIPATGERDRGGPEGPRIRLHDAVPAAPLSPEPGAIGRARPVVRRAGT